MFIETNTRSVVKTLSWRVFATSATALIVFFLTGKLVLAAAVCVLESLSKTALYYVHERLWNRSSFGRKEIRPAVIWFTGLSGSGKSTLSEKVFQELKNRGLRVEHLDGDALRGVFPGTGFSREQRDLHIRRVGHMASRLEKNGVFVVASFVSPYEESRNFVRQLCDNFIEIFVSTPLAVCEKRDPKGLYRKARAGEIENFTGISDPYQPPTNPEIEMDASVLEEDAAAEMIIGRLNKMKFTGRG